MAQNPLLGKRISLISKKNIRYEGLLYSINEQNATVALQNVRSFGTEGREIGDGGGSFVAPSMDVHPYLLFRGQDIKDLHVHDESPSDHPTPPPPPPPTPDAPQITQQPQAVVAPQPPTEKPQTAAPKTAPTSLPTSTTIPEPSPPPPPVPATEEETTTEKELEVADLKQEPLVEDAAKPSRQNNAGREGRNKRGPKGPAVGTGASLLNRKARGVVKDGPSDLIDEFDFQSNLEQLKKEETTDSEARDATTAAPTKSGNYYEKDSFFDTISCDALDKEQGLDNRLRGSAERQLNTETFGAVALNAGGGSGGYYRRGGGRNTGRSSGRGGGRMGGGGRGDRASNPGGRGRVEGRGEQSASARGDGSGRTGRGRRGGRGRGRGGGRSQSTDRQMTQVTAS